MIGLFDLALGSLKSFRPEINAKLNSKQEYITHSLMAVVTSIPTAGVPSQLFKSHCGLCVLTSVLSLGGGGWCGGAVVPVSLCSTTVYTACKWLHRVTAGRQWQAAMAEIRLLFHTVFTTNERAYRCDPAPPELMLSASLVAADARERLEPDWALLRLSAVWNKKELINVLKTLQHHYCILLSISMKKTHKWSFALLWITSLDDLFFYFCEHLGLITMQITPVV